MVTPPSAGARRGLLDYPYLLLAAASLPSLALAAPIYKCAAATGGTVYSQVPKRLRPSNVPIFRASCSST